MAADWVKYPTVLKELNVARSTMEDWRRTGKAPKFHKMPSESC